MIPTTVRQLKPGQQFMLKRTGEWFVFVEKEIGTPFGVRHIVAYDDPYNLKKRNGRKTTLHHSCHVIINPKEKTVSQTMQMEIDRTVNKFTPPMEVGGGFLTRDEYAKLARMAITEGTMIGWAHAENMTRERMQRKITELEHEVSILRDRVKDVEMELLATQK